MASAAVTLNEPIEWEGGPCPVRPDVRVQVQFRSDSEWSIAERLGGTAGNFARCFSWQHHDTAGDIVAYRVVG